MLLYSNNDLVEYNGAEFLHNHRAVPLDDEYEYFRDNYYTFLPYATNG